MSKRGRKPDEKRRRQIVQLRSKGLSFAEIGQQLGITRQRVHATLKSISDPVPSATINCSQCCKPITRRSSRGSTNPPTLCLRCLAKHPRATFGERLRSFRLAAGLTQRALAKKAGLRQALIGACERGASDPKWSGVSKLIRVFGVGLVERREGEGNPNIFGKNPKTPLNMRNSVV